MKSPFRILACALLSLAALQTATALTVSVSPAQRGVSEEGQEASTSLDSLVSGCLDSLFEAGLIATTAPAVVIDESRWSDLSFGLRGAKEGFVDFVLAFYVTWKPSTLKKGVWLAVSCEYRLVRVADGAVLASGSLESEPDSAEIAADPERGARTVGAALGTACVALVSRVSNGGER